MKNSTIVLIITGFVIYCGILLYVFKDSGPQKDLPMIKIGIIKDINVIPVSPTLTQIKMYNGLFIVCEDIPQLMIADTLYGGYKKGELKVIIDKSKKYFKVK